MSGMSKTSNMVSLNTYSLCSGDAIDRTGMTMNRVGWSQAGARCSVNEFGRLSRRANGMEMPGNPVRRFKVIKENSNADGK